MFQSVALLAERNDVEMSVGSRHVGFHTSLHERLLLEAISDEVANADNLEVVLFCHLLELWHTRHCAVFVEDFYEGCCRLKSCETRQVDCCFCVTSPTKHALVLCVERIDVTWSAKICRLAIGVGQSADCCRSVVRADSCRATFQQVHRHGERRSEHARIIFHLVVEFQFGCPACCDGCTEYASAVAKHEVDLFGCNHFGSRDEVALVLAVLIVDHNDELPLPEIVECRFDGAQLHIVIVQVVVHISVLIFLRL